MTKFLLLGHQVLKKKRTNVSNTIQSSSICVADKKKRSCRETEYSQSVLHIDFFLSFVVKGIRVDDETSKGVIVFEKIPQMIFSFDKQIEMS